MATSPSAKTAPPAGSTAAKAVLSQSGTFTTEQLSPDSTSFPPVYEAAILYSADHPLSAEAVLKEYMRTTDGKNSLRAWLMMFDLYQLTHNRKEFDALAMLFTVKFERSPPIWIESTESNDPRRKEKREHKDFFPVNPGSDGSLLSEIDRLEVFAKELGSARVDFAKVKSILPEEGELLAMVFQRLRRAKVHLWFNSVDPFIDTLKRSINERTGQPLGESQGFWSLLFELFILDGKLTEYEELGLEYAVAFEMSPPAWETVNRPQGAASAADGAKDSADAAVGFPLRGVVSAASKEMLQQLSVYASSRQEVAVDMGGLMRIDFMAVSSFVEVIRAIHLQQKRVILSNLNELVAALLEVFGMSKHAILMRKKAS
jgi:ABC-type transporter Mla MlaB component